MVHIMMDEQYYLANSYGKNLSSHHASLIPLCLEIQIFRITNCMARIPWNKAKIHQHPCKVFGQRGLTNNAMVAMVVIT